MYGRDMVHRIVKFICGIIICFTANLMLKQLYSSLDIQNLWTVSTVRHWPVMANTTRTVKQYSRLELLRCRPESKLLSRPNSTVLCAIKEAGIMPRARGKRAGQLRPRIKDNNTGVHWSNLCPVKLDDHKSNCDKWKFLSTSGLLQIASFNAQSLGPLVKQIALREFMIDHKIDIMFVQETWLKQNGDEPKLASMTPPGYSVKSLPRSHHGGGLAVLYRDTLSSHLTFNTNFPFPHTSFEVVQVTLSVPQHAVNFWCLYRTFPSAKNKLTDSTFMLEFPDMLEHCNLIDNSTVILGDMNFHYDKPNQNNTRRMINLLDTFDLVQSVKEPTHNRGHIIDWVVHRSEDTIIKSTTVEQELSSDHYCVVCSLDIKLPSVPEVHRVTRSLRSIDMDAFKQDLSAVTPVCCPTVEELNSRLDKILEEHAPASSKRVKSARSDPWYGTVKEELRDAKSHRRRAERQWLKTGLNVFKDIYITAKRNVTRIIEQAKTLYYSSKVEDCQSSKQLFSVCDHLSGRVKSSALPNTHPSHELPNIFSNFFTSKVSQIRVELDAKSSDCLEIDSLINPKLSSSLGSFRPMSEDEIRKIIIKSKPTTCPLDPIPTTLFLECLDQLLPTVTSLVNESLSTGVFPTPCKAAIVRPLLKKQNLDQNILKNFRPVSNLSFLSKVIEKAVLQQLLEYLNAHSLLCSNQSAYRSSHSTETALLKVTSDILLALDSGHVSLLTLLDLSAAFDTVDHEILFKTLNTYFGISGTVLSWVQSYLSNRTQCVRISDCNSDPANVVYGVPQGSVLGPVLFVMYTKPLLMLIDRSMILNQSFADDTQLYKSFYQSEIWSAVTCLQESISGIKQWMTQNKLKLNDDKTEALLLRNPRLFQSSDMPSSIVVGNSQVHFSHSARDLGYTISDTMSVDIHVTNVCRSAYLAIRQIASIRQFLTVDATKKLVSALVLSRLDYCNSLLAGSPKYVIDRLQRVQNSAARLILKSRKRDHITPLLKSLHWLPVQSRINYKLSILCHNFLSGTAPKYFDDLLSVYVPSRQLRSSADLRTLNVSKVRTKSYGERSFSYCAPKQWNSLPAQLRNIQSTSSFKKCLKTHLFNQYYN